MARNRDRGQCNLAIILFSAYNPGIVSLRSQELIVVPDELLQNKGPLFVGARSLARKIYNDEEKWRSVLSPALRADLGLFMMGNRLCGYGGVIDSRIAAKLRDAVPKPRVTAPKPKKPRRRRKT